jgi:hypothetical protein
MYHILKHANKLICFNHIYGSAATQKIIDCLNRIQNLFQYFKNREMKIFLCTEPYRFYVHKSDEGTQ